MMLARAQSLTAINPGATAPLSARTLRLAYPGFIVGAIFLGGLALRLVCSGGPLWPDEIWSLRNIEPLQHFWQVFWGISHDNNHVANSLWLYVASGWSENAPWLRAPSIVAGALAIPAMARLGARQSAEASIACALLSALSFFFINYSVEARGYAMAMLALVVGFDALERAIDHPSGSARCALAAAGGFGLFCHLALAPALMLFGVIAFGETWRRGRDARAALGASLTIFWPLALAALPALGCFAAGYLVMGGFTIGGVRPFTYSGALIGIASLIATTLGLPAQPLVLAAAALFAPLAIGAAIYALVSPRRRVAYAAMLFAIPAAVFIVQPPNVHHPRYYFACAVFLILLAGDSFGALWSKGGWARGAASLALAACLLGGAVQTWGYLDGKARAWPDALEAIAQSGQTSLGGAYGWGSGHVAYFDADNQPHMELYFFNRGRRPKLELTEPSRYCDAPPAWFILATKATGDNPGARIEVPASGCAIGYALSGVYGASGLSQAPWALYRRVAEPASSPPTMLRPTDVAP